ncbi:DEAD-domain-containing protein [Fomitiporia mediterranea MF3/22]|uniref:DEAD-domain-containing protein n=1 Tax=Fomitiporia mediterranea (strain MF3/22) TaxID=694068 RepID=UPI00044086F1|nr:DEAD-domain-containing protein [Fomitiporia mediterranea MF3/22]EJD03333.1 DEAD-domain-containing protein [Fomitiporia mediterranea MF3/22]
MALLKRKHSLEESNAESSASSSQIVHSDDEVDITAALTGKKAKSSDNVLESDGEDDYEELEALIKDSVAKRDKKEGTKILRQTKGKTKISKGEVGGGSFQSMGLHPPLLRSLTLRGYKVPTPIQRLSIPTLLANPPRDLVGMARTGSGKTLAYMVPLTQRLSGRHATTFGARALILIPTRELALQVLKVGKELVRGWNSTEAGHAGDNTNDDGGDDGGSTKGQALRWGLVVGGESMDEQFEMITSNPDVIIATPGRLLHLIVEMNLDLRSVQYVVFDEADRLFEMGFSTALDEILHRLPSTRQTLLFSATLPKSLVEFAKAGLQDPKLVRLDAESKISSDLRMAFFSVKQAEKDACLLVLLRNIIRVPLGSPAEHDGAEKGKANQKGKGKDSNSRHAAPHQTLIFVATKHHVEYVNALLTTAGYRVSHIYGQLDQAARTLQMERFRRGETSVLVVTDVAARGIDIPVLSHVVNFDFPAGARVFVHRVGRTARAGRTGWAWSFVTATELPHLLDLQLFLGRPLRSTVDTSIVERAYIESLILGAFPRTKIDDETEYIRSLDSGNSSLTTLREVMRRGHGMYERSQAKASQASYKRAKEMMRSGTWGFATTVGETNIHPVFRLMQGTGDIQDGEKEEEARRALLKAVNSFSPAETVFEIGNRGKSAGAALMKDRRKALVKARERAVHTTSIVEYEVRETQESVMPAEDIEMADEDDIEAAFASGSKHGKHRDEEFYLPYVQKDAMTEKGYSLKDGASFAEQASGATFDLTNDEAGTLGTHAGHVRSQLKWDRKKKRFIRGSGEGADNVKIVKTEGGTRLPVTYRSGRFEEWSKKTHVRVPRVGEKESDGAGAKVRGGGGKRFKHQSVTPAKPLHKLNKDYERKARQITKKAQERGGGEEEAENSRPSITKTKKVGVGKKGKSRYGGKPIGRVKSELKSAEQIRKARQVAERKKAKNSRPSRKKGKR